MRVLKGFIGYCGVSGVITRGYPSLWRLAIKSSMGISPGELGSCLTGSSQAEVFPGLSFGIVILELGGLFSSCKLYPFKLLEHGEIDNK